MYKARKAKSNTSLKQNESYIGERIEQKIHRIVNNKEPIKDGAPLIYTDRKEGVLAEMNIRTDRFELAVEAMDKVTAAQLANREARMEGFKDALDKHNQELAKKNQTKDGGAEPVGGTT